MAIEKNNSLVSKPFKTKADQKITLFSIKGFSLYLASCFFLGFSISYLISVL